MLSLLLIWIVNTLALLAVAALVPGVAFASYYSAFATALILGLVNMVIRPILLLLTLPINILTLGLFTFIINALMLWLVASIIKGFTIDSYATALWAAIVLWLISFVSNVLADALTSRS